jgi:hypothetical protein
MYLAAVTELWKRSELLRRAVYTGVVALTFFSAGWISSWAHLKSGQTKTVVREIVKQSDKNNATVAKRTKEAVKADREINARLATLESRRDELYETIDDDDNSCDLTDDELRLFNEIASSAGTEN